MPGVSLKLAPGFFLILDKNFNKKLRNMHSCLIRMCILK